MPSDVVKDSGYKHITVTSDSVSDGVVTFNKYDDSSIRALIPDQASSSNQLADKAFVNSSISTNTANFKGTFESSSQLPTTSLTNNDYAFIKVMDSVTGLVKQYDRYKWNGSAWAFEYTLNNSSFTSEQWQAINSGITDDLVQKIHDAPTKLSEFEDDLGSNPVHTHGQYLTSHQIVTSKMVTDALGYTPYNSSNPNGYTSNVGTITGITMNGSSKGTSGVVDLGTVITEHQDISGLATKDYVDGKVTKLIEVGSYQHSAYGKVFPKITKAKAKEIYETYTGGTTVIMKWTVLGVLPIESTVISSDNIGSTFTFDAIYHNEYMCEFSYTTAQADTEYAETKVVYLNAEGIQSQPLKFGSKSYDGSVEVTLTASDIGAGTYSKPSGGIPATDLASAVQTSLGKADTALQSHQSLADYYNKGEVDSRVLKSGFAYSTTNASVYPWRRIMAMHEITDGFQDRTMIVLFSVPYRSTTPSYGIAKIELRTNNVASQDPQLNCAWLARSNFSDSAIRIAWNATRGHTYLDVYSVSAGDYDGMNYTILATGGRANTNQLGLWDFFNPRSDRGNASAECYSSISVETTTPRAYTSVFNLSDDSGRVRSAIADGDGNTISSTYLKKNENNITIANIVSHGMYVKSLNGSSYSQGIYVVDGGSSSNPYACITLGKGDKSSLISLVYKNDESIYRFDMKKGGNTTFLNIPAENGTLITSESVDSKLTDYYTSTQTDTAISTAIANAITKALNTEV